MKDTILKVNGLSKSFSGLKAVDNVSFKVQKGEKRVIIGPNGAGKTTLFNLLTGILEADSGSIIFDGEEITDEPIYSRIKKGIGRSFQITNTFPELTVDRNLQIACQSSLKERTIPLEYIDRDSVSDRAHKFLKNFGLEDVAGEKAGNLPQGIQKRLDVVMGVVSNPKIFLMDEPTAGLVHSEKKDMMDLITNLSEDLTIILIEHDIDFAMDVADNVTVLDKGSVLAEGKPEEIWKDESVKEAYLGG